MLSIGITAPVSEAPRAVLSLSPESGARRLPTVAFVGLLGAFLLAGTAAAVLVARR